MHMQQRTVRTTVSTGPDDERNTHPRDSDGSRLLEQTIWAKVPFQARRARCLAVRRRGDKLWVVIAGSPAAKWLPAH